MKALIKTLFYFIAIITYTKLPLTAMENDTLVDSDPIAKELLTLYGSINKNWRYPLDCKTCVETTDSWSQLTVNTNRGMVSTIAWDFEKEPSFSKALKEITEAELIMECANAAKVVRLALIATTIGDQGMLKLVSNLKQKHSTSQFNLMSDLTWQFFKKVERDTDNHFYAYPFVNLPEYATYKDGSEGNHNIIKLPNNLYIGFSPNFFTTTKTYNELSPYLFDRFKDASDIKPGMIQKHKKFCSNLSYKVFEKKRNAYQSAMGYYAFDLEAAKEFAKK